MHIPMDRTAHTIDFDAPVVDDWLESKIAQTANAPAVQDRYDDPNLYRWVLYHLTYVLLSVPRSKAIKVLNISLLLEFFILATAKVISGWY